MKRSAASSGPRAFHVHGGVLSDDRFLRRLVPAPARPLSRAGARRQRRWRRHEAESGVSRWAARHDRRDLVNHCVNDILVQGAEPLFFLDYLAHRAGCRRDVAELMIVDGMAAACRENGCALLGGETAEMPGASTVTASTTSPASSSAPSTGSQLVTRSRRSRSGDVLVGVPSSGLHTNGYSLARRVIFEHLGLGVDSYVPRACHGRSARRCSSRIAPTCLSSSRSWREAASRGWPTSRAAGLPTICRACCRAALPQS